VAPSEELVHPLVSMARLIMHENKSDNNFFIYAGCFGNYRGYQIPVYPTITKYGKGIKGGPS
jgi:hypothetical protein